MLACRNLTITNPLAYSILAMHFELWSRCSKAMQEAHFDHFVLLLESSGFKRFNLKQRLAKFSLIRKLLFVLQMEMYPHQMAPVLIQLLTTFLRHYFSADVAIKPVVSYLASNLHEGETTNSFECFLDCLWCRGRNRGLAHVIHVQARQDKSTRKG